jgi:hypothetical protein
MNDTRAFYPMYLKSTETAGVTTAGILAPSVTVVAGVAATASTVFPGTDNNNYVQIQIANKTSVWVHVNFGVLGGGQTVTPATLASGYPVAPGAVVVVSVDKEVNAASVISDGAPAGSTSVIFTRGEGM